MLNLLLTIILIYKKFNYKYIIKNCFIFLAMHSFVLFSFLYLIQNQYF